MVRRAPKVRFILPFLLFFEGSENHCFFDAFLGRQKIGKIRPWGAQGSPKGLRLFVRGTVDGPPYRSKERPFYSKTARREQRIPTRPWAEGPANLREFGVKLSVIVAPVRGSLAVKRGFGIRYSRH